MSASSQNPHPSRGRLETRAVHAGMEGLTESGSHVPPIDLSTTNPLPGVVAGGDSYENLATGGELIPGDSAVYQRLWQPGVARFERALADLEGTDESVAFATGMAALTACLMASVAADTPHVVAVRPLYGGTDHLLGSGLLDVRVSYCAAHEIAATVREDTCLVVVETPANPTLELVDLTAVTRAAGGRPVLVDNTFATPVLQNPAAFGVDLVLHSATKYLGGHGDVIGGVVATSQRWAAALRRVRAVTGALLHPLGGYLLHRGLATLPLRVRAQQAAAAELAGWLATRPEVDRVFYPGLRSCDPEGLVGRQMRGPGAMVSIELAGGFAAAARLTSRVRMFTHAVSLGGVDSLIQHPASLTHRPVPPEARPGAGIVRMSIGLEDVADLRADLTRALEDQPVTGQRELAAAAG